MQRCGCFLAMFMGFAVISEGTEDDVRRAYNSVGVSNFNAVAMRSAFDIDRPEVSEFLFKKMNSTNNWSDMMAWAVMKRLLIADPCRGFEWLLDHYGQFSPYGRANMASSIGYLKCKESFEVLAALLADKATVVDHHAASLSETVIAYEHMRVCDVAYQGLVGLLYTRGDLPSQVIMSHTTTVDRDKVIKQFSEWWMNKSKEILEKQDSLGTMSPSLRNKMQSRFGAQ